MNIQRLFEIVVRDQADNVVCTGKTHNVDVIVKVQDELKRHGYRAWITESIRRKI